jgi:hypothetical protein
MLGSIAAAAAAASRPTDTSSASRPTPASSASSAPCSNRRVLLQRSMHQYDKHVVQRKRIYILSRRSVRHIEMSSVLRNDRRDVMHRYIHYVPRGIHVEFLRIVLQRGVVRGVLQQRKLPRDGATRTPMRGNVVGERMWQRILRGVLPEDRRWVCKHPGELVRVHIVPDWAGIAELLRSRNR